MSTVEDDFVDELMDGASLNDVKDTAFVPITKSKAKKRNLVNKVEHDWTHDEIMRLIVAVEERPVLWDSSLPEYKLPKIGVWKEVADAIGNTTLDDAKARWMSLRIAFKNKLSKYRSKKSRQSAADPVIIQWRYFKSMMFLEANEAQQSTESRPSFALGASANTDASALKDVSEALPPPSANVPGKRKRLETTGPTPSTSPTPTNSLMREVAYNSLNSLRVHNDRFSAFGDYIASELRALPPDRVSFVQRRLNYELLRLLEAEEMSATPQSNQSAVQIVNENGSDIDPSTMVVKETE